MARPKPVPVMTRLLSKIEIQPSGCWEWTGHKTQDGYGLMKYIDKTTGPHRVAYAELVGPIPVGLTLDHLCRNKVCCNPDHLEPCTTGENTRRARALITQCPAGHSYAEHGLNRRDGVKACRICSRERKKAKGERSDRLHRDGSRYGERTITEGAISFAKRTFRVVSEETYDGRLDGLTATFYQASSAARGEHQVLRDSVWLHSFVGAEEALFQRGRNFMDEIVVWRKWVADDK